MGGEARKWRDWRREEVGGEEVNHRGVTRWREGGKICGGGVEKVEGVVAFGSRCDGVGWCPEGYVPQESAQGESEEA